MEKLKRCNMNWNLSWRIDPLEVIADSLQYLTICGYYGAPVVERKIHLLQGPVSTPVNHCSHQNSPKPKRGYLEFSEVGDLVIHDIFEVPN